MYDRQFYSRMVRFQRTAVDNTFAIIASLQGYGDKLLKKTLEQNPWLPEKSKSTCSGLSDSCLSGSQTLRKFIDQGFDEMERLVTRTVIARKSEGETKPALFAPPPAATARKQLARQKPAPSRKPTVSSAAAENAEPLAKTGRQSTTAPGGMSSAAKTTTQAIAKPAEQPVATPVAKPAATSPVPPPPTTAATTTKPSGPSEKTAQNENAAAGKTS